MAYLLFVTKFFICWGYNYINVLNADICKNLRANTVKKIIGCYKFKAKIYLRHIK